MEQKNNKIILDQKQTDLSKFVKVYDNVIPIQKLQKLLKWLNIIQPSYWEAGKIGDTGDGGKLDKSFRVVDCLPLCTHHDSMTNVHYTYFFHEVVLQIVRKYVQDTGIEFHDCNVSQLEILRYNVGGNYKPHVDASLTYPRRLSFIYFLNNDYEGGELHFPGIGKIELQPNRCVIWPSSFMYPHGVKPVTKGVRYSLVSWIN